MFDKPPFKPSFPDIEHDIRTWWRDRRIFEKTLASRSKDQPKSFFDGPITANGVPHRGHMLTFALKDIFPRYWTMQGYHVERSLGWDCQGIPVEYEIEKKLGFKEKSDIEKFGVAEFNQLCRQSVSDHRDKIIELEERMGRWTNDVEEYATMDADYIESVWWSLAELYRKELLYEGFKVVPYSTRAGTTLSNAEVALGGYKPIVDPAVTVSFPVVGQDFSILAWTTTPWTLPTNFALAVGKDIVYAKVLGAGQNYVVAQDLIESVFPDQEIEIVSTMKGSDLIGLSYEPLFDTFVGRKNCFQVYDGFHVTTESGTGVVHLAPYGVEDTEIFHQVGIESIDVIDDQGHFTPDIPAYQGMFYKKANKQIIADLTERGRMLKAEEYEHDMPMCWRTNTPLMYKPITSWYIAMSQLREALVANNQGVSWIPEHIKDGRFGNWLAEVKDWGISRTRYWGTPLPIWKSESGKTKIIGSFAELQELSGVKLDDPHRPFVDDITFEFEGETYQRIPDVLDVWYDSGAMPFARFHYPFENTESFDSKFPAEYIAEGQDQTRGWFYSLMAISTALFGKSPYKQVVVNGMVLADDGQKLSKSKQNYDAPEVLLDQFGADATRINFFSTPISAGEDTTVSASTLKVMTQEYLLPLWNMYSFLVTYANLHQWNPLNDTYAPKEAKNIWLQARMNQTIADVSTELDTYRIPHAMRHIKKYMDDMSKWYIRTSRADFAAGKTEYLATLYQSYVKLLTLLAPFTPFMSEYLYQALVVKIDPQAQESIHLCDWPQSSEYDASLFEKMNAVQIAVEIGFKLRDIAKLKVRQPLAELSIQGVELEPWMKDIIATEVNVKQVRADAIPGEKIEEQGMTVILNTIITPELREEGLVREIIRNLQMTRKNQRLSMEQRVVMTIDASDAIVSSIKKHQAMISEPVGVVEWKFSPVSDTEGSHTVKVEGEKMHVVIEVIGVQTN